MLVLYSYNIGQGRARIFTLQSRPTGREGESISSIAALILASKQLRDVTVCIPRVCVLSSDSKEMKKLKRLTHSLIPLPR